jgi:hypothetical protein
MLVQINISGQVEINDADLERLQKEPVSELGVVLQRTGKNVKSRVAEVYQKEDKSKADKAKTDAANDKAAGQPAAAGAV